MYIKLHQSYRKVIAVADTDLIGKKFEEGKFQLDIRENFYKGSEMQEEELIKFMQRQAKEDASFNIVGEESVKAAIKAGIIFPEYVGRIANIPYALTLL